MQLVVRLPDLTSGVPGAKPSRKNRLSTVFPVFKQLLSVSEAMFGPVLAVLTKSSQSGPIQLAKTASVNANRESVNIHKKSFPSFLF